VQIFSYVNKYKKMMQGKNTSTIISLSGSLRKNSFNSKLAKVANNFVSNCGTRADYLNLADYQLPIFNEDEAKKQTPSKLKSLKELFKNSDGFIIASPEYNSSITGVLKNTIDWLSVSDESEKPLALSAFRGKTALLLSTSLGGLGGLRGLRHLQDILLSIGVHVYPIQVAVPNATSSFKGEELQDANSYKMLKEATEGFVRFTIRLNS